MPKSNISKPIKPHFRKVLVNKKAIENNIRKKLMSDNLKISSQIIAKQRPKNKPDINFKNHKKEKLVLVFAADVNLLNVVSNRSLLDY